MPSELHQSIRHQKRCMGAKCRAQRNQEDGKPAMANKKYWQGELTNVHQEVQQSKASAADEGFSKCTMVALFTFLTKEVKLSKVLEKTKEKLHTATVLALAAINSKKCKLSESLWSPWWFSKQLASSMVIIVPSPSGARTRAGLPSGAVVPLGLAGSGMVLAVIWRAAGVFTSGSSRLCTSKGSSSREVAGGGHKSGDETNRARFYMFYDKIM